MTQRAIPAILLSLIVILHGQLWFGRGSLMSVLKLRQQLSEQNISNQAIREANEQLAEEVRDLKEGMEMVEEKARTELGMVKVNEIYVQIAR